MEKLNDSRISKPYLASILLFMLVLPVISIAVDAGYQSSPSVLYIGKWFVFWAIGIRLFTAGVRQVTKPSFTAKDIFHIDNPESYIIVRELGFANICFGLAGILSLWIPGLRPGGAFTGGLYMGIAGIQHIIKKPSSFNEIVAMASDIFIFLVLAFYLLMMLINVL